jgi:hypothetical protein
MVRGLESGRSQGSGIDQDEDHDMRIRDKILTIQS